MASRESFERFCKKNFNRNREDIENYPDVPAAPLYKHTRSLAHELIESAISYHPSIGSIHFDFISDPLVNAWAAKSDDDGYLIGMTSGAMLMLSIITNMMLANPKIALDIGKPASESDQITKFDWSEPNVEHLFNIGFRPTLPKDHGRALYAMHLTDQALMFLLGHEIAHITRGHVDYLSNARATPFIAELGWHGTGQDTLIRQSIELDADRRSVLARCFSMESTAKASLGICPEWSDKPTDLWSLQYDWAFSVNVFYRLFGDERFLGRDLEFDLYPPLPLRRLACMDYASWLIPKNVENVTQEMTELTFRRAISECEKSYQIMGAPSSGGGLAECLSDKSRSHLREVANVWNGILNDIQIYSSEELYALVI